MIYSVGFCSKQASVTIAKPGFTHMWQTWEVGSTLVIPVHASQSFLIIMTESLLSVIATLFNTLT